MAEVFVQFEDDSEADIAAVFSAPQDVTYWPNQGIVETSDPRYHAYWTASPPMAKQYLPIPN